jgi:hypothetical protein
MHKTKHVFGNKFIYSGSESLRVIQELNTFRYSIVKYFINGIYFWSFWYFYRYLICMHWEWPLVLNTWLLFAQSWWTVLQLRYGALYLAKWVLYPGTLDKILCLWSAPIKWQFIIVVDSRTLGGSQIKAALDFNRRDKARSIS